MEMKQNIPRPRLSFYGDDFTGSTDSMAALAEHGIRTVLFLDIPSSEAMAGRFADIQAFGVAGVSRTMSPAEMEQELKPIFIQLKLLRTPIVHYKICSTFDSSPTVGSIGKAIDIGAEVFEDQRCIPLLVGAPALKRYTLFGNHFATVHEDTFRLDRHPTMSRHPITPMTEADLRLHLSGQTNKSIALMNILDLEGDMDRVRRRWEARMFECPDILLYDALDEERLRNTGALLWQGALHRGNRFVVGSSGVQYALAAYWEYAGILGGSNGSSEGSGDNGNSGSVRSRGPADRMLAVSGSCSPVTESQIRYALRHGFVGVKVETEKLIEPQEAAGTRRLLLARAVDILDRGASPLFYTALGPEDESIAAIRRALNEAGRASADSGRLIGEQLGKLVKDVVAEKRLHRLLVAGGDTSGFVMRELGIYALETRMLLDPGGPMCRCHSQEHRFDGMDVVLKGGQIGRENFFVRVLEGR